MFNWNMECWSMSLLLKSKQCLRCKVKLCTTTYYMYYTIFSDSKFEGFDTLCFMNYRYTPISTVNCVTCYWITNRTIHHVQYCIPSMMYTNWQKLWDQKELLTCWFPQKMFTCLLLENKVKLYTSVKS